MTERRERERTLGWTSPPPDEPASRAVLADSPPPQRDFFAETLPTLGLARTIQAEIVPRLMLAHRDVAEVPDGELAYAITPPSVEDVLELARLIVAEDSDLGRDYVEALRMKGLPVESVFVNLLTPTARLLGEMWLQDHCTFSDVTIGLSRLHRIVGELGSAFMSETDTHRLPGPRAALVAAPGEQHTFGLRLVREFFQRDGWDVWGAHAPGTRELMSLVRDEWISLVGISMSGEEASERVAEVIRDVRVGSLNPGLLILVGGACVVNDPLIAKQVGADAGPASAKEALAVARGHFDRLGSWRQRH